MAKRKPTKRLPDAEALRRMREACRLVVSTLRAGVHLEAVMRSGNDLINSGEHELINKFRPPYGTIHFALVSGLAITLAKLFEDVRDRKEFSRTHQYNTADKASLSILMHFLRQPRCQLPLTTSARQWAGGVPDNADYWEQECRNAIDGALNAYARSRRSAKTRKAIASLKEIRDRALAHTLTRIQEVDYPNYDQLGELLETAIDIVQCAHYAIDGSKVDYRGEDRSLYSDLGRRFWINALVERRNGSGEPNR